MWWPWLPTRRCGDAATRESGVAADRGSDEDHHLVASGFRHELPRLSLGVVERPVLRHRLVRSGDAHLPLAVPIPNNKPLLA